MALIPETKITEFLENIMDDPDSVKEMPSQILTDEDGKYLATIIVPQTDFIKTQAEYMGELSNGVRPKG